MDNWENNLINWLHNTQQELESFWVQTNEEWQKTTQEIEIVINEFTEQIEEIVNTEIDEFMINIENFMTEMFKLWINESYLDDVDNYDYFVDEEHFNSWLQDVKIQPNLEKNPACVGCCNYHGHSYNGTLLVCGIHPYGWEGENCPDWEKDKEN